MPTTDNPPTTEPRPKKPGRLFRHWRLIAGAALALALVGILAGAINLDKKSKDAGLKPAHLLYIDSKKNKFLLSDKTGKQTATADFKAGAYPAYQAVSPKGKILLSLNPGNKTENFSVLENGKITDLSAETAKKLRTATLVDGAHNIYFTSEDSVVFTDCSSASCKLHSLNILTGKTQEVVDTGVKAQQFSPPVYLIGVSEDGKKSFLRVNAKNKLGDNIGALYQVDIATRKVTATTNLPPDAGYTLALSPDRKKVAYKTGGFSQPLTLHIIDIASGKETKTPWEKLEIANTPSALRWSPDASKLLFRASSSIFIASAKKDNPMSLAYLDLAANKVVKLQTVDKATHNTISHHGWLDNETLVYELAKAPAANDFAKASYQSFTQDITAKESTKLSTPGGNLAQILYW